MKLTVLDNGNLQVTANDTERAEIIQGKVHREDFESDSFMYDLFERTIANCEYDWIRPEEIGAMTDAPILGIRGEPRQPRGGENFDNLHLVMFYEGEHYIEDVIKAYGFMDYQVVSVQEQLMNHGYAIFVNAFESTQQERTL